MNIDQRSQRASVVIEKEQNSQFDAMSVERRSRGLREGVVPGRMLNLQDCTIRMPHGSAIFESKPKIINRNPFQDKFAAVEAMMSERSRIKKLMRQSQLSPVTT